MFQVRFESIVENVPPFSIPPPISVVYFIETEDQAFIKIGTSTNMDNRLTTFEQTLGPMEIRLIGCIPGDRNRERELHQQFVGSRTRGEWFRSTPELRQLLDTLEFMPDAIRINKPYRPNQIFVGKLSHIPGNFNIEKSSKGQRRSRRVQLPKADLEALKKRRTLIQKEAARLAAESDELNMLIAMMEQYDGFKPGIKVAKALELHGLKRPERGRRA